MAVTRGRCADAHLGCTCHNDEAVHARRSKDLQEARARSGDLVACPECGADTTPLRIVTWGQCMACRTAQSRSVYPLRW